MENNLSYEELELQKLNKSEFDIQVKFWDGYGAETKTLSLSWEKYQAIKQIICTE